ncbi:telomerase inhibitor [Elasticomyces elasticus]|nr:telomerase inhibitor [Elasticomyces elasticus]
MGLSGPKNRNKFSSDPNNTKWSRDTDSYGHKILASQGWKPGSHLGAKNAAQASHYTAASSSHVRVLLKDDNLGLGAQRGKSNADTFGLSTFSGILGRLNGKSEVQVQKEQAVQRDVQLASYHGQRWGRMNFVSGGFLVGDRVQPPSALPTQPMAQDATSAASGPIASSSKKRKSADEAETEPEKGLKKKKRKSNLRAELEQAEDERIDGQIEQPPATSDRKRESPDPRTTVTAISESSDGKAEKRRRKAEKEARKEDKRREKALKSASTTASSSAVPSEDDRKRQRKLQKKAQKRRERTEASSAGETPTESGAVSFVPTRLHAIPEEPEAPKPQLKVEDGPATFAGGRHAVRHRYIQQKRLASLNPQALKEIFMVKAAS